MTLTDGVDVDSLRMQGKEQTGVGSDGASATAARPGAKAPGTKRPTRYTQMHDEENEPCSSTAAGTQGSAPPVELEAGGGEARKQKVGRKKRGFERVGALSGAYDSSGTGGDGGVAAKDVPAGPVWGTRSLVVSFAAGIMIGSLALLALLDFESRSSPPAAGLMLSPSSLSPPPTPHTPSPHQPHSPLGPLSSQLPPPPSASSAPAAPLTSRLPSSSSPLSPPPTPQAPLPQPPTLSTTRSPSTPPPPEASPFPPDHWVATPTPVPLAGGPFCAGHWAGATACDRCDHIAAPDPSTRADGSPRPHLLFLHIPKTGGEPRQPSRVVASPCQSAPAPLKTGGRAALLTRLSLNPNTISLFGRVEYRVRNSEPDDGEQRPVDKHGAHFGAVCD